MINWLMCTGYASRHDNLRRIPPYIKENNHLYLSGGSVFSSHFPWVRLLYHYLCQWRPLWNISDCKHPVRVRRWKSFHCKSCHSLHAPSLPPSSPSNINPLHFYLPPTFILTETLSATLSLSCIFSERKKNNLFGSLPLSQLLFVSSSQFHFSPPGSISLSLFRSLRVFAWGSERERERVQPHFWHIGSFPLGLRLAAHQHQQVTQEQGRNRKWAACGGDSSLEGLSGSAPLAFIARPSPCQSAEQGT